MDLLFVLFEKTAQRFDFLISYYLDIYDEMLENEIKLSNITSKDSVLVIGGGSLPVTPLLIAMKTNANVVSIDIDQKAVVISSKFIDNLGLKDKIMLEHNDGLFYPIEKFDAIFVVYGVKKEKEILNYLSNNMSPTTRIIFRTTPNVLNNKKNQMDLSSIFEVKNHAQSESLGYVDSLLLCKKKND
jgi:precorrin-6B methylase 2